MTLHTAPAKNPSFSWGVWGYRLTPPPYNSLHDNELRRRKIDGLPLEPLYPP